MHNKALSLFWHTLRWTRGDADGIWVLGMWINYDSCFIPLPFSPNTRDFPKSLSFFRQTRAFRKHFNTERQIKARYIQALRLSGKIRCSFYKSGYLNCHVNTMALESSFSVLAAQQHSHFDSLNKRRKHTDAVGVCGHQLLAWAKTTGELAASNSNKTHCPLLILESQSNFMCTE